MNILILPSLTFLSLPTFIYLIISLLIIVVSTFYVIISRKQNKWINALDFPKFTIIDQNTNNLSEIVLSFKKKIKQYSVIGLDCEWLANHISSTPRHRVALLQLAAFDGTCLLIRLCESTEILPYLCDIFYDDKILKVGVEIVKDARYLEVDYGLTIRGCLDLRFLTGYDYGLSWLADRYLFYKLVKNFKLSCSNWESKQLTKDQLEYAARDAIASIAIFFKFKESNPSCLNFKPFLDRQYKPNHIRLEKKNKTLNHDCSFKCDTKQKSYKKEKCYTRAYATRKLPLYTNCIMLAPDNEVLCNLDINKARWYIGKKRAELICEEPFTIRLTFEPAGRAIGEVGEFYKKDKENRCVVCGRQDSYVRKSIVPREYKKYFPKIMKSHVSHDILLVCIECHLKSTLADDKLKETLTNLCYRNGETQIENHIKNENCNTIRKLINLKSNARALLLHMDKLPVNRIHELKENIQEYYQVYENRQVEVTNELLQTIEKMQIHSSKNLLEDNSQKSHGQLVVEYFTKNSNLFHLERLWREHFLEMMQPKFMPELWSLDHNKERLEIKVREGRLHFDDLKSIGENLWEENFVDFKSKNYAFFFKIQDYKQL